MFGAIRPESFRTITSLPHPEFFAFQTREDKVAAELIGKSIRKLLQKAPVLIQRKYEALLNRVELESQNAGRPITKSEKLEIGDQNLNSLDASKFQSDDSIASNLSDVSDRSKFSVNSNESGVPQQKRKKMKTMVILPTDMINRLVRDAIRMCEQDPSGIRGCQLQIYIEDSISGVSVRLGTINCDSKLPRQTFLRILIQTTYKPEPTHSSRVLINRLLKTANTKNFFIKPGYLIEKRKKT